MPKLTLSDLSNITGNEQSAIATINNNSNSIETAIENTLSRDGTSPNSMAADLDMNSNDIMNVATLEAVSIDANTIEADDFTQDGISITTLLLDWEGQWIISTSYAVGDIVFNGGSSFFCTVAHTSSVLNQPGFGASWESVWDLIVQGGTAGIVTPGVSTDHALVRWDGNVGTAVQNSGIVVDDSDNISGIGTLASGAQTVTGNITVSGTVDGRDVATDGTKLDTIESGAEVNDTATEILTKLLTVDGSGSGIDADFLDGLSSGAFQPIDADLTSIAALTTTTFGRAVLEDANEAAFKSRVNLEANTDYYAPSGTDVPVTDGGTGRSLATAYAVLCGGTTNTGAHQSIAAVGSSGQVLTSNGAGSLPTFETAGSGAVVRISSVTASNSAQIDFTGLNSTYAMYEIILYNIVPATDSVNLRMRTDENNGASFDTGASDYQFAYANTLHDATQDRNADAASDYIELTGTTGNAGEENIGGFIRLYRPSGTLAFLSNWNLTVINGSTQIRSNTGAGVRNTVTSGINAVRLYMSSGNIASGTAVLYGWVN